MEMRYSFLRRLQCCYLRTRKWNGARFTLYWKCKFVLSQFKPTLIAILIQHALKSRADLPLNSLQWRGILLLSSATEYGVNLLQCLAVCWQSSLSAKGERPWRFVSRNVVGDSTSHFCSSICFQKVLVYEIFSCFSEALLSTSSC